jgi:hypothetical protein
MDLEDDGIANIKDRDALQYLLETGMLSRKPYTGEAILVKDFEDKLRSKIQEEKDDLTGSGRQGNWSQVQLPLYIFIFGCMISVSIFKEDWLNSFIGVITLITSGIGAIQTLLKEINLFNRKEKLS